MNPHIKNIVSGIVVLLFLAFLTSQVSAKTLTARFIGNSAFNISDGKYHLMLDFPYTSGAYDSMEYTFDFSQEMSEKGNILSLITHRHSDHFDPFLFERLKWKIIAPPEVTVALSQRKIIKFEKKITYGPVTIFPRKSSHGNTEHFSYLVRWHKKNLFFTGDTEDLKVLEKIPPQATLFITPWFYRKAIVSNRLPETRQIIIYHHRENVIIPNCTQCLIPLQGQEIEIK